MNFDRLVVCFLVWGFFCVFTRVVSSEVFPSLPVGPRRERADTFLFLFSLLGTFASKQDNYNTFCLQWIPRVLLMRCSLLDSIL